eukprot:COSAG05_NODE_2671_length_2779_cov_154.767164_2_plen_86_part_00
MQRIPFLLLSIVRITGTWPGAQGLTGNPCWQVRVFGVMLGNLGATQGAEGLASGRAAASDLSAFVAPVSGILSWVLWCIHIDGGR